MDDLNASWTRMSTWANMESTTSTFGLLGYAILSAIQIIPGVIMFLITFVTITVPTWIYTLLSWSLTVTVSFTTLAIFGLAILSILSYLIRYRSSSYGRTTTDTVRPGPEVEVPDPSSAEAKPGLSNYLDEFLSAIKVFGYLERCVNLCQEASLTRQTRISRTDANDAYETPGSRRSLLSGRRKRLLSGG
jgi:lysophospholipid hydrolase